MSGEDESRSPGEVEAEETETESSPRYGYRDIALSELLDRIYPAVNTSLKSSEDSICHPVQNTTTISNLLGCGYCPGSSLKKVGTYVSLTCIYCGSERPPLLKDNILHAQIHSHSRGRPSLL